MRAQFNVPSRLAVIRCRCSSKREIHELKHLRSLNLCREDCRQFDGTWPWDDRPRLTTNLARAAHAAVQRRGQVMSTEAPFRVDRPAVSVHRGTPWPLTDFNRSDAGIRGSAGQSVPSCVRASAHIDVTCVQSSRDAQVLVNPAQRTLLDSPSAAPRAPRS